MLLSWWTLVVQRLVQYWTAMATFSMCVLLETNCNVFIKYEIALLQNGGIKIQCQSMTMGIESGKEANRNKIST